MRKIFVFATISFFLMSGSCEKFATHSNFIRIQNNSLQVVDCFASYILPDTLLPNNKPEFIEINPESINYLYGYDFNDDNFDRLKNEKLTIFFISKDTMDKI